MKTEPAIYSLPLVETWEQARTWNHRPPSVWQQLLTWRRRG